MIPEYFITDVIPFARGSRPARSNAPAVAGRLALLILGAALVSACGSNVPARVEIVNGHEVEIATAGESDHGTVVFESGLGEDWTHWDKVASEVAMHTRVFAYSRPGYGASGAPTTRRDARQIVEELRSLLTSKGYVPPYVLVGHSFGGTYMELFAKSHPHEVMGLVLVDSRPRDFPAACEAARLDLCGIPEATLVLQSPAIIDEYRSFALVSDQIRMAGAFGSYPVRVLTAAKRASSAARQSLWTAMGAQLAAEAQIGEHIIVQGAGHHIQLDRPDEVVRAILAMLPAMSL